MKNTFLFSFLCICFTVQVFSQKETRLLQAPEDWKFERLDFPLAFAPSLPLTGHEEVYFSPGWDDPTSENFWTYAFAWIPEEPIAFELAKLETYLSTYYDGLMKVTGGTGDISTRVMLNSNENGFEGKVDTLDGFFTKKRVLFYLTIVKPSDSKTWIFRLSPKEKDHKNWKLLREVKVR